MTLPFLTEDSIRGDSALLKAKSMLVPRVSNNMSESLKVVDFSNTIPAYQGNGAYYIDIFVGSPPQRQTVMVDTGSENTALPCTGCENCGIHINSPFDKLISRSFRYLSCDQCLSGSCKPDEDMCVVGTDYVEGSSWIGNEVQDFVRAEGSISGLSHKNRHSNGIQLKFTCMTSNEGQFKAQKVNGIIGMNLNKGSFWNQMYQQGAIGSPQFSMCLRKQPYIPLITDDGYPSGAITLGGVNNRLNNVDMVYIDLEDPDRTGLFRVQIRKIYVHPNGGQRLTGVDRLRSGQTLLLTKDTKMANEGGVIIDSGTTDTILAPELKPMIDTIWKEVLGIPFPTKPMILDPKKLKDWPTMIFQMKGSTSGNSLRQREKNTFFFDEENPNDVLVAFPPSSYMHLNLSTKLYSPGLWMHNNDIGQR